MKTNIILTISFLAAIVSGITQAYAHGGGLDENGCHHDRKRGGYHCH
ncbi:YHYH domain-containing protein [Ensifer sp. Root127]|nr:YHYH domain-containing protein [Ensifer sp. Root127]